MSQPISQQQLESYLWGAATLLRGTIDAGEYKQFIFPILFYKRLCDVFDEETQSALKESGGDKDFAAYPENHRFQIPTEAHWRNVRQAARNVGDALQIAMRAIETANPDKLYGIFGDAQWTNKDRLPDAMLRDLVEHFSTLELAVANLHEDELGQGYEYLIKKFADDSGHTAAEFYTNRTVVHLMTEMLKPQPSESVYDPTCGSGGMLLSCITHLRRQGQEWRNVRLYGQERNLMTSSIARMNCFLHGIEDFQIVRGDTLSEPKFVQRDRLMRFDVVLANPPYSIKRWDRNAFASDPWGRNLFGTPPQGRADFAFWQHILCSLAPKTGRCAILFPHGVLFRQEEAEMRRKLIETDTVECVLGLGANLFYNSPMEACVVICRTAKPKVRKGQVLFINAVNDVSRERAQSFLTDDNIERVVQAYDKFKEEPGFAHVATLEEIRKQGGSLNIPLYVVANEPAAVDNAGGNGNTIAQSLYALLGSASDVGNALTDIFGRKPVSSDRAAMAIVTKMPSWFKRGDWKRIPFGGFAESVNERVDPADAPDEVYVGLDDLDSANLHIRRWGKGRDVIGTKLRFRKGDIIFGRRRAYQRKLAVADIDGICSAHAMVVRAKPQMVLPDFLPFLMTSETFMNKAVAISVGSLSPTINWTTLKLEEFELPPLDQQQHLAEILCALDEDLSAWRVVWIESMTYKSRLLDDLVVHGLQHSTLVKSPVGPVPRGWDVRPLAEVCERVSVGIASAATHAYAKDGIPLIRNQNIKSGFLDCSDLVFVTAEYDEQYAEKRLRAGDVLTVRTGYPGMSAVVPPELESSQSFTTLVSRPISSVLLPEFLCHWINSAHGKSFVNVGKAGAAQQNLNAGMLGQMLLPIPPLREQRDICAVIDGAVQAERQVKNHLDLISRTNAHLRNLLIDR